MMRDPPLELLQSNQYDRQGDISMMRMPSQKRNAEKAYTVCTLRAVRSCGMAFAIAALLPAVMLGTCGGDDLIVELDVFSGRPNPVWNLTEEEAGQFLELIGGLPEVEGEGPREVGLGYRGIIVRDTSPGAPFESISVFECIAAVFAEDRTSLCFDEDRRLELWLLETGEGKIDPDLFRYIRAEIVGEARTKR